MVNFDVTRDEGSLISRIAARSVRLGIHPDKLQASMDITACHANGTPLRLGELYGADKFNFTHDLAGIRDHISRTTGKLEHHFLPRYAKPEGRS